MLTSSRAKSGTCDGSTASPGGGAATWRPWVVIATAAATPVPTKLRRDTPRGSCFIAISGSSMDGSMITPTVQAAGAILADLPTASCTAHGWGAGLAWGERDEDRIRDGRQAPDHDELEHQLIAGEIALDPEPITRRMNRVASLGEHRGFSLEIAI